MVVSGAWNVHSDWQAVAQEWGRELRAGGRYTLLSALVGWDEQHRSAGRRRMEGRAIWL